MERNVAWGTVSVGLPAALSVLLVCFSISLLNGKLLAHEDGNILSASYGVASKCGTIALHISIGIAQGVMPLIGYSYGAKNHKRVHAVCRLSFIILLIFSVVFLAVVQLFPETIVRMFIDHDETVRVGGDFIRCWSWCVIGMSLFNMYNSIFQAVGKWKTSLLLAILRLGVIFSALTLIFDAVFGVRGLMWVQAVTDTIACVIAAVMYEQFKNAVIKEMNAAAEAPAAWIGNRIITISREFGSGGRTIGRQVEEALGIPCYDSEIIEKIAEESGFAREYVASRDESVSVADLYDSIEGAMTDRMWFAQKKVIAELAEKGACVIVGRCADHILRDSADCLTVFVHASEEKRAERIVTEYGQREDAPAKRLADKDKARKAYYELFTGSKWGTCENYDFCLDSGRIGIAACVRMITALYLHKNAAVRETAS